MDGTIFRVFNTGSVRNIPAGSQANLDELRAHYQRKNDEAEAARMERLKKVTNTSKIFDHEDGDGEGEKKGGFASFLEAWGIIGKSTEKKA
ncbi:MAG: hypothetical protein Q9217_001875 [Psora testacea]